MKMKSLLTTLAVFAATALAVLALAGAKEVTLTGDAKCAKCALHETDQCQGVIETEENGKKILYYLAQNQVSKDFHENICQGIHKVKATGTVTKGKDGKMLLTATKLELVK
jgi:hypothetical protein